MLPAPQEAGGWVAALAGDLGEAKMNLPRCEGAATRLQPEERVWREGDEESRGWGRGEVPTWPQPGGGKRPGTGQGRGAARSPPQSSLRGAAVKVVTTPTTLPPPRRWGPRRKMAQQSCAQPCTVLGGVPGWSLHVSLCISKAQSHPVCANHHN